MTNQQTPPPSAFVIDEDDKIDGDDKVSPPQDLVIEDLPEDHDLEGQVHDQLPSVEEYKSNYPSKGTGFSKKIFLGVGGIFAFILICTGAIAIAKKSNNETSYTMISGRTATVEQFLYENKVSNLPDLENIYSPQHQAAAFVADGDSLQMDLSEENARRFVERYVLALLYYHFNGPKWTYNLRFLSGQDHCEWWDEFETPAGKKLRQGVICNDDGYVIGLNLAWNNLIASRMPREIGYFGDLETIHMYYNTIGGSFPDSLRYMTNLKSIGFMKTGMGGTLPSWIGDLTQLTSLALSENQFHGEVPGDIKNLKNLRILGLDDNKVFSGNVDTFKSLSKLEALYLSNNAFSGTLDNLNLPNLLELDVSNNMLDGALPDKLFTHPKLKVLDVHRNLFFGKFPEDIVANSQLEIIAMHDNQIRGTIPDRLAFLSNLKHLDMSYNQLTGTIPDTLTQLTGLRYWATSSNPFEAQSMLDLSRMTDLKELAMKANNVTGKIPDWIGGLSNLQLLDLDANELTGSIPSWIGLLQNLGYLLLNRNSLTGTIPSQLANMHGLDVLLLDGNSITGNADVICQSDNVNPKHFVSDCYPGENGEQPEIECRCCTQCCIDNDTSCNDKKWSSNLDPTWEGSFIRTQYSFSLENAPASYAETRDGENQDDLP